MFFCPWYSLQADVYCSKFHCWITVNWKGQDLDSIWNKKKLSLCSLSLLWSTVPDGMGQFARERVKLYRNFPSCVWIFLFSTLWLWNSRVLKSLQQISPETEEFHTTCLQRPTHNLYTPFTPRACQNWSEQPVSPTLLLQHHWGNITGAAGSSFASSSVIMRKVWSKK